MSLIMMSEEESSRTSSAAEFSEDGLLINELSPNAQYFRRSNGDPTKLTLFLILSVFSAVFGSSTQFGFNLGVLNNIEMVVRSSLSNGHNTSFITSNSFSDVQWASAVAIFAIGGMIGAMVAGIWADLIGRKWGMVTNNITAVVGVLLQSMAVHPYMLIIGRLIIGINAGANTVLAPLYISEISPLRYRGTMGVFHQVSVTLTILASQLLGVKQVLGRGDGDMYGWRILLAIPLVFVTVQLLTLPFCPESPKYLFIKRKKEADAEKALMKLNGSNYNAELNALQEEANYVVAGSVLTTLKDMIIKPPLRRAVLISIALHMSQQITGIGSILMYSTDIFKEAGISNGDIATTVVGLTLFLGTLLTTVLIARLGRRTLMLYGLGGMAIFYSLTSTALCFQYAFYQGSDKYSPTSILLVVFTLCVTLVYSIGPGAIPWLLVSELFQQTARPTAVSIATITNWSSNFVVGFIFPFMLKNLEPYPFIAFIVISGIFWFIIYWYLPETKGKTVDEITYHFQKTSNSSTCNQLCLKLRNNTNSNRNLSRNSSPVRIN